MRFAHCFVLAEYKAFVIHPFCAISSPLYDHLVHLVIIRKHSAPPYHRMIYLGVQHPTAVLFIVSLQCEHTDKRSTGSKRQGLVRFYHLHTTHFKGNCSVCVFVCVCMQALLLKC